MERYLKAQFFYFVKKCYEKPHSIAVALYNHGVKKLRNEDGLKFKPLHR
jgi:hypothetical protein